MIAPRWRKALRDLAGTPFRTTLAVGAMALGIFGVGMILTAYSILTRELGTMYSATRPASAILLTDGVSDAEVEAVRRLPGVRDAEARPMIVGRLRVAEDEWVPLVVFVVRDFAGLRLDRFRREAGDWPPGDDGILIERTGLSVARAAIGDRLTVRAGGRERALRLAGTVHHAGLAPAWMDHVVTGFVTWRSIVRGGEESGALRILVGENGLDAAHIRSVAGGVETFLRGQGHGVRRIDVPPPGRHPHADQMETFLFLLGAFGALTLILGAVLVANMVHSLVAEQVRQVGIMKAIGASTRQIAGLYLGQVSLLAAVSLGVGMPLGQAAGRAYAAFNAEILNAELRSMAVPLWVVLAQMAIGIAVPLAIAVGPVWRASRIAIHQALSNDVGRHPFGTRRFDRWLARLRWLPRPLMLSLRAAFHRRGRLALTVGTLAVGGAVFISALNVSAAWRRTTAAEFDARHYDLEVRLEEPYPVTRVSAAMATVPAVTHVEPWREIGAGVAGTNSRVVLGGVEPGSKLLALPMLRGRWLGAGDREGAVIAQNVRAPLAERITLHANNRDVTLRVVGVAEDLGPAMVYAPAEVVAAISGQPLTMSRGFRVVTRQHTPKAQLAASRELERALKREGIAVQNIQSLADRRKVIEDHLVIIQSALLFAAALVVLVGGLGLSSTLTLNVLERTREIGIVSAIGATPRAISRDVIFEGDLMAVLSWCAAVLLAIPATLVLDGVAGRMFHKTALRFFLSPTAALIWLALVIVLGTASSFYPARRAARIAVREALAYE